MLTRETLEKMTDAGRAELLDRLAAKHYGTASYGIQLGEDFNVHKHAVYRWKKNGPPWAVLYALDAWTRDLDDDRKQLVWAARTALAALTRALEPRADEPSAAAPPSSRGSAR